MSVIVFLETKHQEAGQQSATASVFRNDEGSSKVFFFPHAKSDLPHLAHEVGDHPVEGGALEAKALLAGAEGAEVLRRLGHHVGTQLEQVILKYSF